MEAQGPCRRGRDRQRTCCRASSAVSVSETRRDGRFLARRAIFVSSFKSLPSRDVSSRPALPAICLHHPPRHEPKQSQAEKNNCGGGAGSADLVIDETNQATGKRVFSTVLGRSCDGFQSQRARLRLRLQSNSNFQEPGSTPSSHCTARGVQNEGTGEAPNCSCRRILSQRRGPQMIITQRKGATWADVHGAAPAARLGDAVSLPFRISTGHKHKHNRIPPGRLWLMSLLFLLQEPTSFVPRWCDGLIAGVGSGGL